LKHDVISLLMYEASRDRGKTIWNLPITTIGGATSPCCREGEILVWASLCCLARPFFLILSLTRLPRPRVLGSLISPRSPQLLVLGIFLEERSAVPGRREQQQTTALARPHL